MSTIQSLGIGSGLKIDEIVTAIVDAERVPAEQSLTKREEIVTAKISAYGEIRSRLSSFQSSLSALKLSSNFNQRDATSSNTSAFTATASAISEVADYAVEVSQTAQAQSLATPAFSNVEDVIGSGTLTVKFGATTITEDPAAYDFVQDTSAEEQVITIDSSNNTVSSLKDHINASDYGFSASIINDGSGFRLVLSAEPGAKNSLQLSVSDDADGNNTDQAGLSQLTMDDTQQYLTQNVAALDAELSINGIAITSESNTVANAVNGITLELFETTSSAASLSVTAKTEGVKEQVSAMVESYNEFMSYTSELTAFSAADGEGSLLLGDSTTRNMVNQLRSTMFGQVSGVSSGLQALSNIGILSTTSDGTLTFDEEAFDKALASSGEEFQGLFATAGTTTDADITFISGNSLTKPGDYAVEITQTATKGNYQGAGVLPDFAGGATLDINSDNDEFALSIDGLDTGTLTLASNTYSSGEALATQIQSTINGAPNLEGKGVNVAVTYNSDSNNFIIESSAYGSSSSVTIQSIDSNSTSQLGFAVGSGTDGENVAGSINGVAGTGSGQFLSIETGDAVGLKIGVLGGEASPEGTSRGTVTFSRGIADQLDNLIESFLKPKEGYLSNRVDGLDDSLASLSDDKDSLNFKMQNLETRLLAQFNSIDVVVGELNNLSSFLTSALASLPGAQKKE